VVRRNRSLCVLCYIKHYQGGASAVRRNRSSRVFCDINTIQVGRRCTSMGRRSVDVRRCVGGESVHVFGVICSISSLTSGSKALLHFRPENGFRYSLKFISEKHRIEGALAVYTPPPNKIKCSIAFQPRKFSTVWRSVTQVIDPE
jgi:hypothetical protein